MKLYIADIRGITPDKISLISPKRAKKVQKYSRDADKKRCIAGGLLIKRFLGDTEIYTNKYGKPYCKNGAYFNISHSGDYVVFVLSDCEIGCDIQRTDYIKTENAAKIVFCDNEKQILHNAFDKTGMFYSLWTKKESLLKCIGEGFHRSSKSVDVSKSVFEENSKRYYFRTWNFSDYVISVCSEKNDISAQLEFITL